MAVGPDEPDVPGPGAKISRVTRPRFDGLTTLLRGAEGVERMARFVESEVRILSAGSAHLCDCCELERILRQIVPRDLEFHRAFRRRLRR